MPDGKPELIAYTPEMRAQIAQARSVYAGYRKSGHTHQQATEALRQQGFAEVAVRRAGESG